MTCPFTPRIDERGAAIVLTLDIQIKRLDGKRMLLSPEGKDLVLPSEPEPKRLIDAIGLAYRWHDELLKSGASIRGTTREFGVSEGRIRKLLPLTHLSPTILRHALRGTLSPSVTLNDLRSAAEHLDWALQAKSLGLSTAASANDS